jgi:hypothetical protein
LDEPVALAAVDDFLARLPARLSPKEWLVRAARQAEFLARLKLGRLPT